ncbi:MAG TPA: hypothetical protein VHN99_00655 [Deinococcales bacterium]|nr:hypothetical protein [Deinococcales bacterium]
MTAQVTPTKPTPTRPLRPSHWKGGATLNHQGLTLTMPRVPFREILTRALENALAVAVDRSHLAPIDRAGSDTPLWVTRHAPAQGSVLRAAAESTQAQLEDLAWERRLRLERGEDTDRLDRREERLLRDRTDLLTRLAGVSTTPRFKPEALGPYFLTIPALTVTCREGAFQLERDAHLTTQVSPFVWKGLLEWRFTDARARGDTPIWRVKNGLYELRVPEELEAYFFAAVAHLTPPLQAGFSPVSGVE